MHIILILAEIELHYCSFFCIIIFVSEREYSGTFYRGHRAPLLDLVLIFSGVATNKVHLCVKDNIYGSRVSFIRIYTN